MIEPDSFSSTAPDLATRRKATGIGLLICLAAVLIWFSPWWLGGRNLAPLDVLNQMMEPWREGSHQVTAKNHIVSDAVDQYLIYRMVAAESYKTEGWLGWSSLTYGGTPQYANTMALYYDWTMQLHRWFDFWTAWHLGLMTQVMLAASGMLLFLRGRSIGIVWACCGALAFAANSQFVTWIYHRWALGAFCWVPWILWAIDCHRQGKRSAWVLVPAFISLAFLGGTLQHGIYVALVVVAMWGEEAIKTGKMPVRQIKLIGRYAAWGILGAGLAGMMLVPCADEFLLSTKLGLHMGMHGTAGMGLYPKGLLQPVLNLAAYPLQIFPSILGRSETVDLLKLFRSELFYVAYFGSLPVLIALLAFFRKQTPLLARLLIGIGLLLPLTPVLRHLYQRLYLLFILGGIFAFVHFMENASEATKRSLFKFTAWAAGLAIAAWTGLSVVLKIQEPMVTAFLKRKIVEPSGGSSFGFFQEWMQGRAAKFQADLFIWSPQQLIPLGLFLIGLVGVRMNASGKIRQKHVGALMVTLAVILEVSVFGARWVNFVDPHENPLYPVTPEVTVLKEKAKDGRIATVIDASGSHMAVTPFIPNTLSPYGIATIHGYDSIMPNGMLLINNPNRNSSYMGKMGVSHLITYPGHPPLDGEWNKIWQSPAMELYENPASVPRYTGFSSDEQKDAFFKEASTPGLPSFTETTKKENSREINVPAGTTWVRIAENQASGWEYRFKDSPDSRWLPVLRAQDASMLIPGGTKADTDSRILQMRYDPPARRIGFMLSIGSLVITILIGAAALLKRPVPARFPA